eukprot:352761-Chlamydomonas_euryale.AAC.5
MALVAWVAALSTAVVCSRACVPLDLRSLSAAAVLTYALQVWRERRAKALLLVLTGRNLLILWPGFEKRRQRNVPWTGRPGGAD